MMAIAFIWLADMRLVRFTELYVIYTNAQNNNQCCKINRCETMERRVCSVRDTDEKIPYTIFSLSSSYSLEEFKSVSYNIFILFKENHYEDFIYPLIFS